MLIEHENCIKDNKSPKVARQELVARILGELLNDPLGRGYASMTADQIAESLMQTEVKTTVYFEQDISYSGEGKPPKNCVPKKETSCRTDTIFIRPRYEEIIEGVPYAKNSITADDLSTII